MAFLSLTCRLGRSDKCEAAKAALLALVPVTAEVNVPVDLHRFIIGMKGKDVREMMTTYDVNIKGNAQWDCSSPFLPSIHPSIHPSIPPDSIRL